MEPKKKKQEAPAEEQRQRRQLTTADWRKIRIEYVKGKTTCKKLAEKWGISESAIRKKSSQEGWKSRRNKLSTNIEQKVLERVCDARAREFEAIARANDRLGEALDNILSFVNTQPPGTYEDMRGVESLAKAIAQVVQTKRDLYNVPSEIDRAKIEALREKNQLEREKWRTEVEEKAASKASAAGTVWKIETDEAEVEPIDE